MKIKFGKDTQIVPTYVVIHHGVVVDVRFDASDYLISDSYNRECLIIPIDVGGEVEVDLSPYEEAKA